MATYLKNLEWRSRPEEYTEPELKVLIALSHKDFLWRSIDGIRNAVKLPESDLGIALRDLMENGIVRASASKDWSQALFGLAERVDLELLAKTGFKRWPY